MENGPTGREWGEMSREVQEIRHDLRNMKLLVDHQYELLRELEAKYGSMNAKIYTAISVAALFAGILGFAVNVYVSI